MKPSTSIRLSVWQLICACFAILASCFGLREDFAKADEDPRLSLNLYLVSAKPQPFQAVRIRYVHRNGSNDRVGATYWGEQFRFPGIKGPHESRDQPLYHPVLLRDPRISEEGSARERHTIKVPVFLGPGEFVSCSQAASAEWVGGRKTPFTAMFPKSGVYTLVLHRYEGWADRTLDVECVTPSGADRAIFQQLSDDSELARAMLSAVHVSDLDAIDALRRLIDTNPTSSYADYARFALARAYLKGVTIIDWPDDEWTKRIDHVLQNPRGLSRDERVADFSGFFFDKRRPRGKLKALVSELLDAKDGPADKREALIRRVVELLHVSKEDRREAATLIEQIKSADFAYRPNALMLLRNAVAPDDPERAKEIADEINRECPDSLEWLEEIAKDIPQSEWLEYRIKHSVDAPRGVTK